MYFIWFAGCWYLHTECREFPDSAKFNDWQWTCNARKTSVQPRQWRWRTNITALVRAQSLRCGWSWLTAVTLTPSHTHRPVDFAVSHLPTAADWWIFVTRQHFRPRTGTSVGVDNYFPIFNQSSHLLYQKKVCKNLTANTTNTDTTGTGKSSQSLSKAYP